MRDDQLKRLDSAGGENRSRSVWVAPQLTVVAVDDLTQAVPGPLSDNGYQPQS